MSPMVRVRNCDRHHPMVTARWALVPSCQNAGILPTSMSPPTAPSRHSYTKDRAQLLRRLSRMEGQVRGVARMIEREEYCIDILQQTAALRAAVDAVSLMLMEDHVAGCLTTAVKTGDAQSYTEEVMEVVRRSMGRPVRARTTD